MEQRVPSGAAALPKPQAVGWDTGTVTTTFRRSPEAPPGAARQTPWATPEQGTEGLGRLSFARGGTEGQEPTLAATSEVLSAFSSPCREIKRCRRSVAAGLAGSRRRRRAPAPVWLLPGTPGAGDSAGGEVRAAAGGALGSGDLPIWKDNNQAAAP